MGGGTIDRPPAELGADADGILAEAGYGGEEITALREDGLI